MEFLFWHVRIVYLTPDLLLECCDRFLQNIVLDRTHNENIGCYTCLISKPTGKEQKVHLPLRLKIVCDTIIHQHTRLLHERAQIVEQRERLVRLIIFLLLDLATFALRILTLTRQNLPFYLENQAKFDKILQFATHRIQLRINAPRKLAHVKCPLRAL